ncbi:MAG: DUF72 domain-containing protein [Verrucomicrobia bacterium]|nr:DUF72 domain-containing protein [Verrucomicrobiota bacterium]
MWTQTGRAMNQSRVLFTRHRYVRACKSSAVLVVANVTAQNILVGTASWSDPGFVEYWYPKKMAAADRLPWYAQHFNMVEVNSTFYSVPEPTMVARWCAATPPDFIFDVKLHQLFSHHSTPAKLLPPSIQEKLGLEKTAKVPLNADTEGAVWDAFRTSLRVLQMANNLGVLLLQLSPAFSSRKYRLEDLRHLFELAHGYRIAVELRNRNWFEDGQLEQTLRFLREHCAIFVNVDAPSANHFTVVPSDLDAVTNPDVAYLRLHGRDARAYLKGKTVAERFCYDYSDAEIDEVAQRSERLTREAKQVHVVFNNNARDYAPHAALRLRKALGQIASVPARAAELF